MTPSEPRLPSPMPRLAALKRLLEPSHIRASFVLSKQISLRNSALAGLQAAAVSAIALPIVYVSPWADLIGFASLGALVALFGRFAPPHRRNLILLLCALCQSSAVFVMSVAAWSGVALVAQLVLLAFLCGAFFFVSVAGRFGPPGALIFVFAAGAGMAPPEDFQEILARTAATGAVAILAWVLCAASEAWRRHPAGEQTLPADPPRPLSHLLVAASRIMLGTGIAVFGSHALGAPHPVWAAMGAISVMQGAHLHTNMSRALQRMTGTVVGAIFAWIFLCLSPSPWTLMAVLVVLQFATEVIIGTNYGLGQILVTPMALVMVYLASLGSAGPEMAPERVMDTILGAAIGIVVAILLSSLDERRYLSLQSAGHKSAGHRGEKATPRHP